MADLDLVAQQADLLDPAEAAELLEISQATLRRWSGRFDAFLDGSESVLADGPRYSGNDLEVLARIKGWLEEGWTYDQVTTKLHEARDGAALAPSDYADATWAEQPTDDDPAMVFDEVETSVRALQPVEALAPAARFVREAIQGLTDTQQIILNSQQASRSLMGVMIQDNLNLKSEAAGLRDRMLELERDLAEQRRRYADYRERTETRVHVLEDTVARLMSGAPGATASPPAPTNSPATPPPATSERRGFWSRLLGG